MMDNTAFYLSFRLLRNPSEKVIIKVIQQGIPLLDKFYFLLPAHILYLLFSDYGTLAVAAEFIIHKPVQIILSRKTVRIEIVLMLIDSSYEVISYPNIQGRPRIGHNAHGKSFISHTVIISERFRTSRNDNQNRNDNQKSKPLYLV